MKIKIRPLNQLVRFAPAIVFSPKKEVGKLPAAGGGNKPPRPPERIPIGRNSLNH